ARVESTVAADDAIEVVPGVELDTGFGGDQVEREGARGSGESRTGQPNITVAAQNQVVVIATKFFKERSDPRANQTRRSEIEGSVRDRGDLAGRDLFLVHRRIAVGVEPKLVIKDLSVAR